MLAVGADLATDVTTRRSSVALGPARLLVPTCSSLRSRFVSCLLALSATSPGVRNCRSQSPLARPYQSTKPEPKPGLVGTIIAPSRADRQSPRWANSRNVASPHACRGAISAAQCSAAAIPSGPSRSRRDTRRSRRHVPASPRPTSPRCRRSERSSGRRDRRGPSSAPGSSADSSSAIGISVAPRSASSSSRPWTGSSHSSIPLGSSACRAAAASSASQAPLASIRIASSGPPNARTAATRPASSPMPTLSLTVR